VVVDGTRWGWFWIAIGSPWRDRSNFKSQKQLQASPSRFHRTPITPSSFSPSTHRSSPPFEHSFHLQLY
jgi:hypothetical protein